MLVQPRLMYPSKAFVTTDLFAMMFVDYIPISVTLLIYQVLNHATFTGIGLPIYIFVAR